MSPHEQDSIRLKILDCSNIHLLSEKPVEHAVTNLNPVYLLLVAAGSIGASMPVMAINTDLSTLQQATTQDSAQPLQLDTLKLLGLTPGEIVYFNLPSVGNYPIVFEHTTGNVNGVAYWEGYVPGNKSMRVSLKFDGNGWSGFIDGPKGKLVVGYANGANWVASVGKDHTIGNLAALTPIFSAPRQGANGRKAFPGEVAAKVVHPISLNLAELTSVAPNSEVALNLPGFGKMPVVFERSEATESGNTNWIGYLRDWGTDYRIIMTYGVDGAFGRILTPEGEFQLESYGSEQWLVDVSASGLSGHFSLQPDALIPPGHTSIAAGMAAAPTTAGATSTTGTTSTSTTTTTVDTSNFSTVDLMVLFTDGLAQRLGAGLSVRLDNLVAISNQAYIDSGISIKIRMVAAKQLAYTDSNNNSTALNDLLNGQLDPFKTVKTLRDSVGADVVTLIRPFIASKQVSCGVGYIGGFNGSPIRYYGNYALSVVSDGRDVNGSSSYCTDYTMVHEVGHNMGSMHDRATVKAQGGGTGAYPYSFGYGKSGTFGTIMSYISPRIGKFSNPTVTTCANQACGISETDLANSANNALSLNNVRVDVANFRPTKVALSTSTRVKLNGVVSYNGQGLANVLLTPSDTGAVCGFTGSNGAFSCSVRYGWTGTITPSLSGYSFTPIKYSVSNLTTSKTDVVITATR